MPPLRANSTQTHIIRNIGRFLEPGTYGIKVNSSDRFYSLSETGNFYEKVNGYDNPTNTWFIFEITEENSSFVGDLSHSYFCGFCNKSRQNNLTEDTLLLLCLLLLL